MHFCYKQCTAYQASSKCLKEIVKKEMYTNNRSQSDTYRNLKI